MIPICHRLPWQGTIIFSPLERRELLQGCDRHPRFLGATRDIPVAVIAIGPPRIVRRCLETASLPVCTLLVRPLRRYYYCTTRRLPLRLSRSARWHPHPRRSCGMSACLYRCTDMSLYWLCMRAVENS